MEGQKVDLISWGGQTRNQPDWKGMKKGERVAGAS